MEQKILLALDGSENSTKAVKYLGDMIHGCEGFHITIFHVVGIPPELMEHGGAEKGGATQPDRERLLAEELQENQRKWREQVLEKVEKEIFAPAKRILGDRGFQGALSTIETKVAINSHPDVALAIIEEIDDDGYATIVIGKRGRSKIKEFLLGGVTCKVIHHIQGCTVWVVE